MEPERPGWTDELHVLQGLQERLLVLDATLYLGERLSCDPTGDVALVGELVRNPSELCTVGIDERLVVG